LIASRARYLAIHAARGSICAAARAAALAPHWAQPRPARSAPKATKSRSLFWCGSTQARTSLPSLVSAIPANLEAALGWRMANGGAQRQSARDSKIGVAGGQICSQEASPRGWWLAGSSVVWMAARSARGGPERRAWRPDL
jgi:hypothetical protein